MAYQPQMNADSLTLYIGACAVGKAVAASTDLTNILFTQLPGQPAPTALTADDVGLPIAICGGGPVDPLMPPPYFVQGGMFHTTIAAVISPTECTLAAAPTTGIYNTGFATVIVYRPCPFANDTSTNQLAFGLQRSIAPGTSDTLDFCVINRDNDYVDRFTVICNGQPVYLTRTDDSGVTEEFGGYIDSLTTSSFPGVNQVYSWSAKCTSWQGLARRRKVPPAIPQQFTNVNGDVVFRTLVLDYLRDDSVSASGPTAPPVNLDAPIGADIGQLLDQLVGLVSDQTTAWYWTSDAWRNYILTTRTATSAPWDVEDGSDLLSGDEPLLQSITETHNQLANNIFAIGQNTLLNALNATFTGTPDADTTFNTPLIIGAAPVIKLNGNPQSVGLLGVDTGKDWYWSQGSTVITQDSGGTPILESDTLLVAYATSTPAVAMAPNVASLQTLQGIEGTSANYDYSIAISRPILPADLLAFCTAYEIEYGEPAKTVQLYTLRPGLEVGQLQTIDLAQAGISGTFLIATVQVSIIGGNTLLWTYTAFGGANIGNAITAMVQFINRGQATLSIITPLTPITGSPTPQAGNYASGTADTGGGGLPLSYPSTVNQGDLLFVIAAKNTGGNPQIVTDSQGNTYTQAVIAQNPGSFPNVVAILWAIASATGPVEVTCNTAKYVTIGAISGIDPTIPVGTTASSSGSAPAITVAPSNGGVVVTGMCMDATADVPTVTPPEQLVGYSLNGGPASDCAGALDIQSAAGTFTSSLASAALNPIYVSVCFNRAAATAPPVQTVNVPGNPQGTVTHVTGALGSDLPVLGNGGPDVKSGDAGQLVPAGGTTGQVLSKLSGADFHADWETVAGTGTVTHTGTLSSGLPVLGNGGADIVVGVAGQLVPPGGAAGQVLAKTTDSDFDADWQTLGLGPVPVVVQSAAAAGASTLAFGSAVQEGNLLVVFISLSGGTGAWTVTDTLGTTYAQVATGTNGSTPTTGTFFTGIAPSAGANTVVIAGVVGGFAGPGLCLMEIAGSDGTIEAFTTASGTTAPAVTTLTDNGLIIVGVSAPGDPETFAATAPAVIEASDAGHSFAWALAVASMPTSTAGSYTPGVSTSSTTALIISMALRTFHGPTLPPGGTTGQVLTKTSDVDFEAAWGTSSGVTVTTKGDLQGFSTVPARVPVGADGEVLTADSSAAAGVSWQAGGGGSGGTVPTSGWSGVNGIVYNDFPTPQTLGFFVIDSGSLNWRFVSQSLSTGIPYTWIVTVRFFDPNNSNSQTMGIYLSDGTKLIGFEMLNQGSSVNRLRVERMNSVTSDNTTVAGPTANLTPFFLVSFKVTNDGTNRTFFYYSAGAWVQFYQEASGSFLTETVIGVGGLSAVGSAGAVVAGEIVAWSLA